MKAKYYMRGIGLGMMLIAGGMLVAGIPSEKEGLSKEEIVEAAKQYGLAVTEEETEDSEGMLNLEGIVGSSNKTEKEEEETGSEENNSESNSDFLEESSDAIEESSNLKADVIEAVEEKTPEAEANTEDRAENSGKEQNGIDQENIGEEDGRSENAREYAIVEVTSGMYGREFARIAYQAGLISDQEDFERYMAVNRYANKMHTGVYQIEIGSTYEEICKIITTRRY
ncbi:MAG: endolytic transglycosylase MltG [Lachnospiraceae bacterium]|nr:endolytic transglycosylase MltG [Lachnospiraceae bacterium]